MSLVSLSQDTIKPLELRFKKAAKPPGRVVVRPKRAVSVAGKHRGGGAGGHPALFRQTGQSEALLPPSEVFRSDSGDEAEIR
jgi:hypothetical protein